MVSIWRDVRKYSRVLPNMVVRLMLVVVKVSSLTLER